MSAWRKILSWEGAGILRKGDIVEVTDLEGLVQYQYNSDEQMQRLRDFIAAGYTQWVVASDTPSRYDIVLLLGLVDGKVPKQGRKSVLVFYDDWQKYFRLIPTKAEPEPVPKFAVGDRVRVRLSVDDAAWNVDSAIDLHDAFYGPNRHSKAGDAAILTLLLMIAGARVESVEPGIVGEPPTYRLRFNAPFLREFFGESYSLSWHDYDLVRLAR